MNKKNSGFSLVELIVVIAIMAVLVGVLAPAYLKYVEKSRKSADLDTLDVVIKAADTCVGDDEYVDVFLGGDEFKITFASSGGKATMSYTCGSGDLSHNSTDATSVWMDVANVKSADLTMKSKVAKKERATITGAVQSNGSVKWSYSGAADGGLLKDDAAKTFVNKLKS